MINLTGLAAGRLLFQSMATVLVTATFAAGAACALAGTVLMARVRESSASGEE